MARPAHHMQNVTRLLLDAAAAEKEGIMVRVEGSLRGALEQMDLAGHDGPLYKDTVGRLAQVMFGYQANRVSL